MLSQLLECPPLNASFVLASELLLTQLKKLAINVAINPLTVIFECYNGEIFNSSERQALISALVGETSRVIQTIVRASSGLPETAVLDQFAPERLGAIVSDVGSQTASNISSMRQDVLAGRKTEIDYINGYVLAQATEFGVDAPINARLVELVKSKKVVSDSEIAATFGI